MKKIIHLCIIVSILVGAFCYMMFSASAFIDTTAAQQEKEAADSEMQAAKQNQTYLQSEIDRITQQKASLEETQYVTQAQLDSKMTEAEKLAKEIDDVSTAITQSQGNFDDKQNQLKLRLKTMYKNSNSTAFVRVFLESQNINDMLERYHYLEKMYDADRKLMADFVAAKADLEIKKAMDENTKSQTLAAAEQAKADINTITVDRAAAENTIAVNEQSLEYWKQQEAAFQQQSLELTKQILQAQNLNSAYSSGIMAWPVPGYGYITQYYGYFPFPFWPYDLTFHNAIDIGAPYGADIVAANSGNVIFSGWQTGYGYCVFIDHGGGISTVYGHASVLDVTAGQHVEKGQTIAQIGATGWATGPHTHFEVRVNGQNVNPQEYVSYY